MMVASLKASPPSSVILIATVLTHAALLFIMCLWLYLHKDTFPVCIQGVRPLCGLDGI